MITEEKIRKMVAQELKVPEDMLQPDTVLQSLPGFDSVQFLMLMVALEEMGLKMPTQDAARLRTFGDILALERS